MKLADDTPDEESIGGRNLTRWPTPVGRGLVRVVAALAANVTANSVLYGTAAVGLAVNGSGKSADRRGATGHGG